MDRRIYTIGLLVGVFLQGQGVGIGTALPDPSARLHIEDNQRGLLIPRLGLSARNVAAPVVNPAFGLLVFNTATAGAGSNRVWPGFYWWNGSEWVRLLVYPNEAWQIEGNFGTDPSIHFLGTIDNQPLRIRVNNQQTLQFNTNFSIQRDAGGNSRGTDAVDLQRRRNSPTQVASGTASVISGGENNTASGLWSVVGGGYGNSASGNLCTIAGGGGNTVSGGAYGTIGGGQGNTAVGGATIGGGTFNTASGAHSTIAGGRVNTASGWYSSVGGGDGNTASGPNSVACGGALNEASGAYSVVVGGFGNTSNADYVLTYGQQVVPSTIESHRVYFFGDGSIAPSGLPRTSGFIVINRLDGDHPIHVGTDGTNGNGAYLSAGGTWTNASSREKKDRYTPLNPQEVLQEIRQLPIQGWYYKGTQEYHIGPFAEDFHAAFNTGIQDMPEYAKTSLAASDVAGVALIGIQALAQENASLREENAQLKAQLEALHKEVGALRSLEAENTAMRQALLHLEKRLQDLEKQIYPVSSR
ncbi:MAG: hypothetical protein N3E49_05655 [Bacteroidia bacterium]|nr:hypothetical protein [Bacteroidia bacterium]